MDELTNSQELARRFNEDEVVWRAYENRRRLRLLKRIESLPSDAIVDELDWIEAERAARTIRCIGKDFPNA
jgi:hypothetical protein